jgi:hypothetical protein
MATRKTMERWVILGFELSVLKARGKIDTIEGCRYLESLNLLVEDEWKTMVPGDRHTTVWYWIQQKAVNLTEENIISSELRLQTICTAVTLMRDRANDLMSCIDRDQPIAYTFVVGLLVNLNLVILSLRKGIQWAIWFYDTKGMIWATPKMYTDLMVTISYTIIFAMLYDISRVLYNPFGSRDELDIPHDMVGGGIRNLAKRLGDAKRCRPSTMSEKNDSSRNADMLSVPIYNMRENIAFEAKQVFGGGKRTSRVCGTMGTD